VGDIAEAGELYTRRLGYHIESPVIHDPKQQAYVQFLKLTGDTVLLELVSPDAAESRLQAALSKGYPLHHVCYSADDIDQACGELRRRGMTLISPPVEAVAFQGRRIAWLIGRGQMLMELVEEGATILQ